MSFDEQVQVVRECRIALAHAVEERERAERAEIVCERALREADRALREEVEILIGPPPFLEKAADRRDVPCSFG